ncbi:MAG TPA: GEVED domain-containing protein [Haliscomenobacter sp.]|nr:GEVED domain-containing protein [Haliscomenobacter sp.]
MKKSLYLILLLIFPMLSQAQSSGYCNTKAPRSNVWIQKVAIGNWAYNSGGNGGYLYIPDSKLALRTDTTYDLQLDLGGYPRIQDTAYWSIWIDLNRDADFEDAGELLHQAKSLHRSKAKGAIRLPSLSADTSAFFMRITLSKGGFSPACGGNTVFETEDYQITIQSKSNCIAPTVQHIGIRNLQQNQVTLKTIGLTGAVLSWNITRENGTFPLYLSDFKEDSVVLTGLVEDALYKVRLGIKCEIEETQWSDFVSFRTLKRDSNSCELFSISKLSAIQIDPTQFLLGISKLNAQIIEWRYRKTGLNNTWRYQSTKDENTLRISDLFLETAYEFQVRQYCPNLNAWSDWSESYSFSTLDCVLPPEKNVFIHTTFANYPSLDLSFNVFDIRQYEHTYRYYFRAKGSQPWVEALGSTSRWAQIQGLVPDSTYEIRVEVFCGPRSANFIKTVTVPPSCFKIEKNTIEFENPTNTSIVVYSSIGYARTCQYRYRIKGGVAFSYKTVNAYNGYLTLEDLVPGTTYEVSARVICADTTQQDDWSELVEFRTKSCLIPLAGDLAVIQYYAVDSVLLSADFFADKFDSELDYFWKYKLQKNQQWSTQYQKGDNLFLLKNLIKGAKYEVQVTVKCPNSPLDSLFLSTMLTAAPEQCGQAPDTALIHISYSEDLNPIVSFTLSTIPLYQVRIRRQNEVFKDYLGVIPAEYSVSFGNVPVPLDLQFRVICQNGNISPWSETIKIASRKGYTSNPDLQLYKISKAMSNKDMHIRLTPNPSSGLISINVPSDEIMVSEGNLEIFNTAGQKIFQQKVNVSPAAQITADLSNQTSGLYFVRLLIGKQVFTERLMLVK